MIATLALAGGALGASSASAQAASWQASYPSATSLSADINSSDAPSGSLSNTTAVICTNGSIANLDTAFATDRTSTLEFTDLSSYRNTGGTSPSPAGSWAVQPWSVLSTVSSTDSADGAQTLDGRWWWFPSTGDSTPLSSEDFPAGISQVSCSYYVTAIDLVDEGADPGDPSQSDLYDQYTTYVLVGTPTTTTYEIEPNGVPTVSFDNSNPATGGWANGPQAVTVDTGNLAAGDSPEIACATPGGVYQIAATSNGSITIPASYGTSGTNIYSCQITNQIGEQSTTASLSFNVDSIPPTGQIIPPTTPQGGEFVAPNPPIGPWNVPNVNYTATDDYTVTIGPSGLASGSCTITDTDTNAYPGSGATDPDAGASTTYQLTGATALSAPHGITNPSNDGSGTYQFSVPLYQGANSVACHAVNGAGASSPTYTASPLVDSVMPSVAFDGGAGTVTKGSTLWINSPSGRVDLVALAGASGLATPLTGAQAGTGPAEDPNDASIACTPTNNNVAIGSPTSTSLLTSADLTSNQVADGFVIGVQNTYQPTGSGLTTLDCVSMNGAGVYQNSPLMQAIGIDTVTPTLTLSDTSAVSSTSDKWASNWQSSTPTVTIDASTTGASGIAGMTCTVNGTSVMPTTATGNPGGGAGSYAYTLPADAFSNGGNAISCVSDSGDDLTSQADSQTLNLDTTQPTIAAANLPANGWQTSDDVSFNATSGPSGISSVVCTVDAGAPHTYTPSAGTSRWSVGVPLGGDGRHSADCVVTSDSGLTADTGPITIGADNQTPGISWTGVPASQWVSSVVPVTVTGTAGPSGVKSVTCQLDDGAWTTTAGGTASISITGSGAHSISCYDSGNSGLQSAIQTQQVQVDTVVPTESFSGAAADQWLTNSTSQAITVNATAGLSGVQSIQCTIDGVAQAPVNPSNEQFNSSTGIYGTSAAFPVVGNGRHSVSCRTQAGSGAETAPQTEEIDIDASAPSLTLADAGQPLANGGWFAGAQTLTATATTGPSGISQTAYDGRGGLECQVDGGDEQISNSSSEQISVSGSGSHTIACAVSDAASIAYTLPTQVLNIDSVTPTVALSGATFDSWTKTDQTVTVTAQGGQSGLNTPVCDVDGQPVTLAPVTGALAPTPAAGYANAGVWTFPVTGTGNHAVQCSVQDPAGLAASTDVEHVQISQPAGTDGDPDPDGGSNSTSPYGSSVSIDGGGDPYSSGPSQTSWSKSTQSVVLTANPAPGAAPIAAIHCSGVAGLQGNGDFPATASNQTSQGGEQVTVNVGDPGGDLVCTATDQASNTYQLGSYDFLVDSKAPTGQVLPQSQWPALNDIAIAVGDGSGSGVKTVELDLTGNGLDDVVPAAYDQGSGHWIATVNDAAINPGSYSLVVKASDNAGNTGAVATQSLTLPLRAQTTLSISAKARTTNMNTAKTAACKRAKARGEATAAGGCKPSTVGDRVVTLQNGSLTTPYGRKVTVYGKLLNARTKKPLTGTQLTVSATPADGGAASPLATVNTNKTGGYTYELPAAESRTVTVAYAGSSTALGAAASFKQQVPGKVTAKVAAHLRAGRAAVLSGRVLGGYAPNAGVQIHVEYEIPGHTRGWSLFQAAHTTKTGSFALRFPVSKAAKGYTYRLRVVIPAQSGWPFQATTSTTLVRKISK